MIFVQSASSTNLAKLISSPTPFSLVATTCRSCAKQLSTKMSSSLKGNEISPNVIRNTRMYDCACKVAGEDVKILAGHHMALSVTVEDLADNMDTECRVYGVCTGDSTLTRLNELEKGSLLLPYLPGAFL